MDNSTTCEDEKYWLKHVIPLSAENKARFLQYAHREGFFLALDKMRSSLLYSSFRFLMSKIADGWYPKKIDRLTIWRNKEFDELTLRLVNKWNILYYWKKSKHSIFNMYSDACIAGSLISSIIMNKKYEAELKEIKSIADAIRIIKMNLCPEEHNNFLYELWSNYPNEIPLNNSHSKKLLKDLVYAMITRIEAKYPKLIYLTFFYYLTPDLFKQIETYNLDNLNHLAKEHLKENYPNIDFKSTPTKSTINKKRKETILELHDFFVKNNITFSRQVYLPIIQITNLLYRGILRIEPLYPENTEGKEAVKKLLQRR